MAKKRQTPRPQDRARVQRTVSLRIKDIRRSGVSQREIADRLGVNVSTVRRWENQERTANRQSREAIYRLWRRTPKRLGVPGAVVNLSEYFKRVWFDENGVNLPLNYRPVPTYEWPTVGAPVTLTVFGEAETTGEQGGEEWIDANMTVRGLRSGDDLAAAVERRFLEYVETLNRRYKVQLLKYTMKRVLLRWRNL